MSAQCQISKVEHMDIPGLLDPSTCAKLKHGSTLQWILLNVCQNHKEKMLFWLWRTDLQNMQHEQVPS